MEEPKLDNELKRLYQSLAFLWKDHGFHLTYLVSGQDGQPCEIVMGLESKACKLLFKLEDGSSLGAVRCYIGTRFAWFSTPNYQYSALYGWYSFTGLLNWFEGVPYQADESTKIDLETLSQALRLHLDELLELFKESKKVGEKLAQVRNMHGNSYRAENIQTDGTTPHGGTQ